MQTYCLVCKKATDNANTKTVMTKTGRLQMKSLCTICGKQKSRFVSKGSALFASLRLNTPLNRQKNALWNVFNL